jgi:hypothetical protein
VRTRLAVATVGVLGLLLSGAAQAAPIVVEPEDLPRGAGATITVGHGFELRAGNGTIIPLPESESGMTLLGRVADGWVVWEHAFLGVDGTADRLYLIEGDGTATMFHELLLPYLEDGFRETHYRLSDSRTRIAQVISKDGFGNIAVLDLNGDKVASQGFNGSTVLDFSGPRMIVGTSAGVGAAESWRIGNEPRTIVERPANFADIGHDLLSREMFDGSFGLARISRPGAIRWRADWTPLRLSPDGTKLVGSAMPSSAGPQEILQIRRVSDGKVLRAFKVDRVGGIGETVAWESNTSILFEGRNDEGARVLVRCTVGGYCARASAWFTGLDAELSVAFETGTF